MLTYTPDQVASIIALPLTVILLFWTVVIFHKNRKKWGPYDIPIVAVLILSILRNCTILGYVLSVIFATATGFNTEYCGIVTWIFNSIHTFQASSLTSIAVIGLFSAKLYRKNQSLRTFLTSTHVVYHLFCLTTLCACVGVAAILAQKTSNVFADSFDVSPCDFLPFELDIKFNVFIIVLHVFLASISFACFMAICYNYYKTKKRGFDYIKKSNSDLSELSNNFHGINGNVPNDNRNFYDTYTISRNDNNNYKDTWSNERHLTTNSEMLSNHSTTVSSTNSRRPCIVKPSHEEEEEEREVRRTGLETMHPVLIVCYLFYHLPVIVLCIYPRLIYPWSVAGIALWLGLVQDLLIPVGLGIVDSRFCGWVSNVYRCTTKNKEEKLPQVGLDGKFRPFGLSSQPQSLDIGHQERAKTLQQMEHRFPITNGSLYTSIDGRLPVIHNYRRHKEFRTGTLKQHQELQSSNVALHSSHLNRRDLEEDSLQKKINKYSSCSNCSMDQCPSHSDLHHLTPQRVQRKLSFLQVSQNNVFATNGERKDVLASCIFVGNKRLQNTQNSLQRNQIRLLEGSRVRSPGKRLSQSQESINHLYLDCKLGDNILYHKSDINVASPHQPLLARNNLLRMNKMRLSRSEDSLKDIQIMEHLPLPRLSHQKLDNQETIQYSSDDDDSCFNHEGSIVKDCDSMSSSNSITTEANCDFEFYQTSDPTSSRVTNNLVFENNGQVVINGSPNKDKGIKHVSNTKITRSNSRRSLENLQTFIEESLELESKIKNCDNVNKVVILQRSNSYTTLEDKRRKRKVKKTLSRSNSKASESIIIVESPLNVRNKKVKSVEFLPYFTNHTVYIEDLKNNNNLKSVGHSVPDFKKVFISDYI